MADEKPWYAPDYVDSLQGTVCTPRPREPLWTLTKAGRRVDAELLFHAEHGVEVQFMYGGELAYGRRFNLRELALEEAEVHRQRLTREGWTAPTTDHPAD